LREALTLPVENRQRLAILNNLSYALSHLGDPGVEQVLLEGTRIADNEAHPQERASMRSDTYSHLANYRMQQGDLQGALDAYRVAYLAALEAGDEEASARWLNSLSHLSMTLGKWDDAYKMLGEASKIHERLGDRQALAFASLAYARVHLFTDHLNEAGRYAAQAYALFSNEQRPGDMAAAADILGQVYIHKGDLARAEACVRYGLAKSEALATRPYRCRALGQLADLAAKQGRHAEALDLYEEAVALARELGTLMLEADIVGDRAHLHVERRDLPAAESDYRRAIEIADLVRGGLRTADRRMHIQHMATSDYAGLIRLLVHQPERVGARQDALNLAERVRSRTLAEMLSRTTIPHPESMRLDLATREVALLLQLRQADDNDDDSEAAQRIIQINEELEKIWDAMGRIDANCRRYVDLRRLPSVGVDDMRALLGNR
jgi:tetratricopeptide (TPR) repeat protein